MVVGVSRHPRVRGLFLSPSPPPRSLLAHAARAGSFLFSLGVRLCGAVAYCLTAVLGFRTLRRLVQLAWMHYMETYHGLKAGTPIKLCLVGLAFIFAPAFTAGHSEEPVGGITFHEAERLAMQRRAQRLRREKADKAAADAARQQTPADGCRPAALQPHVQPQALDARRKAKRE